MFTFVWRVFNINGVEFLLININKNVFIINNYEMRKANFTRQLLFVCGYLHSHRKVILSGGWCFYLMGCRFGGYWRIFL